MKGKLSALNSSKMTPTTRCVLLLGTWALTNISGPTTLPSKLRSPGQEWWLLYNTWSIRYELRPYNLRMLQPYGNNDVQRGLDMALQQLVRMGCDIRELIE